jgi:hypothetical protein
LTLVLAASLSLRNLSLSAKEKPRPNPSHGEIVAADEPSPPSKRRKLLSIRIITRSLLV